MEDVLITFPETLLLEKYKWFPCKCKTTELHYSKGTAYYVPYEYYLEYMHDPEYFIESQIKGYDIEYSMLTKDTIAFVERNEEVLV